MCVFVFSTLQARIRRGAPIALYRATYLPACKIIGVNGSKFVQWTKKPVLCVPFRARHERPSPSICSDDIR